jgi:hypothetical protein
MFFYSWVAGIGWFLGALFFAAFSAYAINYSTKTRLSAFG